MAELETLAAPVRAWLGRAWDYMGGLLPEAGTAPPVGPAAARKLLVKPALAGLAASLAISLGAAQPSSPFAAWKKPGAWFFGTSSASPPGGPLLALVAVYGGMLVLGKTWYGLTRTLAARPGVPLKGVAWVMALWVLPILVAPPLFSRDLYSYAAQGEMVSHHISPYEYGPSVIGANAYSDLVDPLWGNAAAPYGPLFLGAAGVVTRLTAHDELATVVGMRLLAVLGVALLAVSVPKLARRFGRDPALAFTLAVLNPITLLHLVGGGHNDALMVGLLVAGLTLAKLDRPVLGIVACSLAAAVKVPALLGVVYIGWEWLGPGVEWRQRLRPLLTAGLVSLAVLAGLARVTGLGWGWLLALGTPGTVRSLLAPATAIGVGLGNLAHLVGVGPSPSTYLTLARGAGLAVAAALAAGLLWASERIGSTRAIGLSLLGFVVLGPVVQPWYLAWGLILLAPVATGRLRVLIIWLSVAAASIRLPGERLMFDELGRASPGSLVVALLVLAAIPSTPLASWGRRLLERLRQPAAT